MIFGNENLWSYDMIHIKMPHREYKLLIQWWWGNEKTWWDTVSLWNCLKLIKEDYQNESSENYLFAIGNEGRNGKSTILGKKISSP